MASRAAVALLLLVGVLAANAAVAAAAGAGAGAPSSWSCTGDDDPRGRTCKLTGVCYNSEGWWFYKGDGAAAAGGALPPSPLAHIGTYAYSPKLELKTSEAAAPSGSAASWIAEPTLMMYCPATKDMHFLHDETYGLWFLKRHFGLLDNMHVRILLETPVGFEHPENHHFHMFSDQEATNVRDLLKNGTTCFDELYVGPAQHHLGGPGVIRLEREEAVAFREFIMTQEGIEKLPAPTSVLITLFVRETTPMIKNTAEVLEYLESLGFEVQVAHPQRMDLHELWRLMRRTTLLITPHGHEMDNAMFMPVGSAVLEVFPYQYLRLSHQQMVRLIGVEHLFYQNRVRDNTFFHPELLERIGLKDAEKVAIKARPEYMKNPMGNVYWSNQDTIVEIRDLRILVEQALETTALNRELRLKQRTDRISERQQKQQQQQQQQQQQDSEL